MPICILYCEVCKTRQNQPLAEGDFGVLLATGWVTIYCPSCSKPTNWKLALPPRLAAPARSHTGPLRLLVIDDDRQTLQVLQMMLRSKAYTVDVATSADEAVQKLQTADYDAIVSDIKMPEFDGPSLFRFLAIYLPDYIGKVVFLTGDQSEKTLRFLKESGSPYTFKPIDLNELESCIRRVG